MGRHKPNRRPPRRDPGELRDNRTMISTENHMELWHRLEKAHRQGIHNPPGEPKKRHG